MNKPKGVKHSQGKLKWRLLHLFFPREVVKVLSYGSRKYSDDNWQDVVIERGPEEYYDAFMRHWDAHWSGELHDLESGLLHLSHCACNLFFLMWYYLFHEKVADYKEPIKEMERGEDDTND